MTLLIHITNVIAAITSRAKRADDGASMVEYALLLALVAVVCLAAVSLLGQSAAEKFSTIADAVSGA